MPLFPYLGEIAKIEKQQSVNSTKKNHKKFGNVERFNHNENKNRRLPNLTFETILGFFSIIFVAVGGF